MRWRACGAGAWQWGRGRAGCCCRRRLVTPWRRRHTRHLSVLHTPSARSPLPPIPTTPAAASLLGHCRQRGARLLGLGNLGGAGGGGGERAVPAGSACLQRPPACRPPLPDARCPLPAARCPLPAERCAPSRLPPLLLAARAAQGTGFEYMTAPWLTWDQYDVKVGGWGGWAGAAGGWARGVLVRWSPPACRRASRVPIHRRTHHHIDLSSTQPPSHFKPSGSTTAWCATRPIDAHHPTHPPTLNPTRSTTTSCTTWRARAWACGGEGMEAPTGRRGWAGGALGRRAGGPRGVRRANAALRRRLSPFSPHPPPPRRSCYDCLLAHNTIVRCGSRGQSLEVNFGPRACNGERHIGTARSSLWIAAPAAVRGPSWLLPPGPPRNTTPCALPQATSSAARRTPQPAAGASLQQARPGSPTATSASQTTLSSTPPSPRCAAATPPRALPCPASTPVLHCAAVDGGERRRLLPCAAAGRMPHALAARLTARHPHRASAHQLADVQHPVAPLTVHVHPPSRPPTHPPALPHTLPPARRP